MGIVYMKDQPFSNRVETERFENPMNIRSNEVLQRKQDSMKLQDYVNRDGEHKKLYQKEKGIP
jgi:hypothetical protein